MTEFLVWFKDHIAQWWQFLCASKIPSTEISYAALILAIVGFNFFLFIVRIVLSVAHPEVDEAIQQYKASHKRKIGF